ncbi:hypothetical protein B9Z55_003226 [Caenorhabditis nigoni]|uniref:Uncharacterized protein n=1 Tax=Caenorhabditis nigoni TaxID=1611254 RepID=A0A2G5VP85_9PELO|nr:hypothetical protein B9Z55_003226 [Caenorhabditis nigoni]
MNIFRWICYFDNKLFVLVALLCLFIVETCYRYPRGQKEVEDRRNPPVKEFVITKKDDPEEVTSSELMESSYSGKTSFEFSQLVFGEIFVFGTTPSEASTEPMTPSESPTSPDSEEISPVPSPGPWVVSRIQNRVIVYSYVLCGRRCDQLGIENITSSCISAHSITKKLVREVCCPNYNPSEKLIIQKLFITIWQIVYDLFYESYEPSAASEPIKKLPEGKRAQSADDQTQEIVTDENRKGQRAQEPSGTFDIAHAFGILQVTLPNHCSYVTVEESQESADKGSLTAASKPHNSAALQPKIGFKMALGTILMISFRAPRP